MTNMTNTDSRVALAILECFATDYDPSAADVAMMLCEEDVSNGEYEGCSDELDLAASGYMAEAAGLLGEEL